MAKATNTGPSDKNNANANTRPIITGSKGGNAALASLITQLHAAGLINDKTT